MFFLIILLISVDSVVMSFFSLLIFVSGVFLASFLITLILVSLILSFVSGFYFIDFHSDLYYFPSSACHGFALLFSASQGRSWDHWLEIFLVFNMDIYCYEFPLNFPLNLAFYRHCTSFEFFYFYFFNYKYFLIPLLIFFLHTCYLKVFYSVSIWRCSISLVLISNWIPL